MRLGKEALELLKAEITGMLQPGDQIVVAGDIGLSGTVQLVEEQEDNLKKRFSPGFLRDCKELWIHYGAIQPGQLPQESQVWQTAQKAGASALFALGSGGFLSGLWKMAEASGVGLVIDLREVPVRQESIEICEQLDRNPYRICCEGALLIGISGGYRLVEEYKRAGLAAAVIGEANTSNDRLLYSGEHARYLERPRDGR